MSRSVKLENVEVNARKEDVSTLDGMMNVFYEIVSGNEGQNRDWDRDRSLYVPGALFVPTGIKDSKPSIQVLDHDGYIERSAPNLMSGFFEREIHRVTRTFGNLAHVFSTYEARRTEDGPVFMRGINSIELVFDGTRWWIVSAIWDIEREGNPIPSEYLPKGV